MIRILLIICTLSAFFNGSQTSNLTVQIDNVESTSGVIWVGVYDSADNFLNKDKAILKRIEIRHPGVVSLRISDLLYGKDYAVAVLHDLNNNGDLDRNFFGIPTEPFAFSGTIHSSWRAPRFDEVKFRLVRYEQTVYLHLKSWWDF